MVSLNKKINFEIEKETHTILKNGAPFQVISGSIQYFRIEPKYWKHAMQQALAMGMNTIETYVPWNHHEPIAGEFTFENRNNIVQFLDIAHLLELKVILRVGPYNGAELDNGGIPNWVSSRTLAIRSKDPIYINLVTVWLDTLFSKLKRHFITNGGPITMIQMENMYGSYQCDSEYLLVLKDIFRARIPEQIILFTIDSCDSATLKCGGIDSVLRTVRMGPTANVLECSKTFRTYQKDGPMIVMEYETGQPTFWGHERRVYDYKMVAATLDIILREKMGVNLYTFMGGTSFEFADRGSQIISKDFFTYITSHDNDGPLDEAANVRPQYFDYQYIISKYLNIELPDPIPNVNFLQIPKIQFRHSATVWDMLPHLVDKVDFASEPKTMDDMKYYSGFMLISKVLLDAKGIIQIESVSDFAVISYDSRIIGTVSRDDKKQSVAVNAAQAGRIDILVFSEGRPDSGPKMHDPKGVSGIYYDKDKMQEWYHYMFLKDSSKINQMAQALRTNVLVDIDYGFFLATFELKEREILSTYVYLQGFIKGVAYVNGYQLGHYDFDKGPQYTLYLPSSFIRPGINELVVFELKKSTCGSVVGCSASFVREPLWK